MPRGGARPGAGRKRKEPKLHSLAGDGAKVRTALELLVEIINSETIDIRLRIDAAKALLPYQATKPNRLSIGKKDERQEAAERVSKGKFSPGAPPSKIIQIKRGQE